MAEYQLWPGMKYEFERDVTNDMTADHVGSGSVHVFATPMMIAWMEEAAVAAVQPQLPEGYTTVGTMVNILHLASTKVGGTVRVVAEVTEVKGGRITYQVKAYDDQNKIGEGTHGRAVVEVAKFMGKK